MKNRYSYITIIIAAITLIYSCKKDNIISTHDRVGISKVTYLPILTVLGDPIVAVANGSTFNDPGATAKAGSDDAPVTTSGSINTSKDGVYTVTYTAYNKDGLSSSGSRTVVVYTTLPDAAANDLSGAYVRPYNGVISYWTKLAPGVYIVANPGGAGSGANLTVIAFNKTGNNISVPSQRSSDGNISSASSITFTPTTYSWIFLNPGYGTGLRTFEKQ